MEEYVNLVKRFTEAQDKYNKLMLNKLTEIDNQLSFKHSSMKLKLPMH